MFRWVSCFQLPLVPAQTSGGAEKELRMAAEIFPSAETETEGPQVDVVGVPVSVVEERFARRGIALNALERRAKEMARQGAEAAKAEAPKADAKKPEATKA